MTDGKQTVRADDETARGRHRSEAAEAKVPVSMIAFGTDHGSIKINDERIPVPLDTAAMQQIAEISGGDFHTAATAEELQVGLRRARRADRLRDSSSRTSSRPWMIAGTMLSSLGRRRWRSARGSPDAGACPRPPESAAAG